MKPPHWETNSNNSLLSSPVWWPTTFIVTTIATISTTSKTWNEGGGGWKKEEVFIWYKMKHVTYTSDFLKQGLQVFHVQLPGTTTNFHIRVYTQQKSHLLSEDSIFVNILCKKNLNKIQDNLLCIKYSTLPDFCTTLSKTTTNIMRQGSMLFSSRLLGIKSLKFQHWDLVTQKAKNHSSYVPLQAKTAESDVSNFTHLSHRIFI